MSIELQNLDCNCNNCVYMERDLSKFQKSLEDHKRWQLDSFNSDKENAIRGIVFQFDKSQCYINYGYCSKILKEVSFIPNTLQLDTQECFVNRKEQPDP